MKVLVVGGGGREHAMCWKLAAGESVEKLEAEDYSERAFEETESVLADLLAQVRHARAQLHQVRPREEHPDPGLAGV